MHYGVIPGSGVGTTGALGAGALPQIAVEVRVMLRDAMLIVRTHAAYRLEHLLKIIFLRHCQVCCDEEVLEANPLRKTNLH